jgi:hypothetical protein
MDTKYSGNDNYKRPKADYLAKLTAMDNKKLFEETKSMIWLSAYAHNNIRSDYHWQCDACYDEWIKREGNSNSYQKAWDYEFANN